MNRNTTFRKILCLLLLILMTAVLAACGKKKENADAQEILPDRAEEEQETTEESEEVPAEVMVENNGGYFVGIDGSVYFRVYGDEALYKEATFGNFLYGATGKGTSLIVCYDPVKDEVSTVFEDAGFGPIYYYDGQFYLQKLDADRNQYFYRRDLATGKEETLGTGTIAAFDEESGCYVIDAYDPSYRHTVQLWKDDVMLAQSPVLDDLSYGYAAIGDGYLYYIAEAWEEDLVYIYSAALDETAFTDADLCLGSMEADFGMSQFEIAKIITDGKKLYFATAFYEGTGHFYAGGAVYEANGSKADSLKMIDDSSMVEMPFTIWLTGAGDLMYLEGNAPGDVFVSNGALIRINEIGEEETVCEGLYREFDERPISEEVEKVEVVGKAAYMMLHTQMYDEINAIGWRDCYDLLKTDYVRVDLSEKEPAVITEGAAGYGPMAARVWVYVSSEVVDAYDLFYEPMDDSGEEDHGMEWRAFEGFVGKCSEDMVFDCPDRMSEEILDLLEGEEISDADRLSVYLLAHNVVAFDPVKIGYSYYNAYEISEDMALAAPVYLKLYFNAAGEICRAEVWE